jgi:hypothetical protein
MADPISILGLLAGIITFVEFGYNVISGTRSVRGSKHGMTPETEELDKIVVRVQRYNDDIMAQLVGRRTLTDDEKYIVAMVRESETLEKLLRKAIAKLKVRDGTRSKVIESSRVAFHSLLISKELQDLGKRFTALDQRIRNGVQFLLQL